MSKAVLITGSNGGIGAAILAKFRRNGYAVIGCGRRPDKQECDKYIQVDFSELATNDNLQNSVYAQIQKHLQNYELAALINNSAVQILSPTRDLTIDAFRKTLNVNSVAPFILSKFCLDQLESSSGCIVNIGSIHSKLTKKQFVAYATSKGALETMTKAMAVDLGGTVRVNMIAPAAIETEMLVDGFKSSPEKYDMLASCHPVGVLGRPEEIADLTYFVVDGAGRFLSGSVLDMSGGISGKLHDPD